MHAFFAELTFKIWLKKQRRKKVRGGLQQGARRLQILGRGENIKTKSQVRKHRVSLFLIRQ